MNAPFLPPWQRPSAGPTADLAARHAALVPEVRTPRLRLRATRLEDYPLFTRFPLYSLFGRDRTAALAPGDGMPGWLDFCQLVAGWALRGFGPWTVEPAQGGAAVGAVIINHEYGHPEPELGWLVVPSAEGRGYATEAARAALDHAFGPMGFETLVSYIGPENAASIGVAERLGARRDARAEAAMRHEFLVYRHTRDPEIPT